MWMCIMHALVLQLQPRTSMWTWQKSDERLVDGFEPLSPNSFVRQQIGILETRRKNSMREWATQRRMPVYIHKIPLLVGFGWNEQCKYTGNFLFTSYCRVYV